MTIKLIKKLKLKIKNIRNKFKKKQIQKFRKYI